MLISSFMFLTYAVIVVYGGWCTYVSGILDHGTILKIAVIAYDAKRYDARCSETCSVPIHVIVSSYLRTYVADGEAIGVVVAMGSVVDAVVVVRDRVATTAADACTNLV